VIHRVISKSLNNQKG